MPPRVTVIIPVFNRAERVSKAIHSIASQTFEDWELIVVDDGSSIPVSEELFSDMPDGKFRLVRHEKNLGASAARNTGILAARGAYVSFLDSDDEWHPEKLARQIALVESDSDPLSVFCVTQTLVMGTGRRHIRPHRTIRSGENWGEFLYVEDGFAQTNSFLLSTELARRVLFSPTVRKHGDHLFFLRAGALGGRYRLVEEPLNIWYHDTRPDRISMLPDLRHSRQFLAEAGDLLTEKARTAFQIRYLGPLLFKENPRAALKLFAHGAVRRAVRPLDLLKVAVRCSLPPQGVETLRRVFNR